MSEVYQPLKPSRCRPMLLRGVEYNIREWGEAGAPLLVMLHGHQDSSISWQFTVDHFKRDWRVVAPDWRGFGHSAWNAQGYWMLDYMADLDALLEVLSPQEPVDILSHSLGGNVSNTYAGVRPDRVRRIIAIDGFGLRHRPSEDAPVQFERFLKGWREPLRGHRPYESTEEMAQRLMKANAKLDAPRARFLAGHQSRQCEDGSLVWSFDPGHARPFGTLHKIDEWAACWRRITCPALWIGSGSVFPPGIEGSDFGFEWRLQQIPHARFERIEGTSHNVHHDAPQRVAEIAEDFFA